MEVVYISDSSYPIILVLGSKGNLGSQIVRELRTKKSGHIIAWTRKDCDVMDMYDVKVKLRQVRPSIIINTVAYNDVDACELNLDEQRKAIKLNIQLVECLSCICQEINAKLIHFSTNYVFSGGKTSYTELDSTSPINFYGMTKQLGEEAVLKRLSAGLRGSIIRVSNLFGPRGSSVSSKSSFFDVIAKIAEVKDSLDIVDDEKSCFTYTRDVARAMAKVINNDDFLGIYHFVNSGPVTWYEAAQIYFKLINKPISLRPVENKFFKRAAKRPQSEVLQATRTIPMRDFRLAITEYIQEL